MSSVTILYGSFTYLAVPDVMNMRTALVTGTVVDEATAIGLDTVALRVDRPGVRGRVNAGGFFAAAGSVDALFPDLATTAYALVLTFTTDRHLDKTLAVAIPAGSLFPLDQGFVRMRPMPVRLEGRVTRESIRTPIAGARVALKSPVTAVLLRTPAHLAHAGVSLTPKALAIAPGATTLTQPLPAGETLLHLNSVAAIGSGSVLRFGAPPVAEYAVVTSVDAAAKTAILSHPLWRSLGATEAVQPVSAAGAGAVATTRDIDRGDSLVQLAAAMAADAIEISDPSPSRVEYHETGLISDANGFFGAGGIAGVRSLTLRASAAGFIPLDQDWTVDSGQAVAELSFRLKV
jgi:hypothetical protein